MEIEIEEWESLLSLKDESAKRKIRTEAWEEFRKSLSCPLFDCDWNLNAKRKTPSDPRLLLVYLKDWAIAKRKHRIHHLFPGRFSRYRQKVRRYGAALQAYKDSPSSARAEELAHAIRLLGYEPYLRGTGIIQLPPVSAVRMDWEAFRLELKLWLESLDYP